MVTAAALTAAAILAGCSEKPGEGGLTAEDNRQLDNAAEMLEVPSDSLVANDEMLLGNGEEESVEEGDVAITNDALVSNIANGQ
jgi:hypothetical protein